MLADCNRYREVPKQTDLDTRAKDWPVNPSSVQAKQEIISQISGGRAGVLDNA
jgi:hypothetical protein